MQRYCRCAWILLAIIGLAGLPENLRQLLEWSRFVNWDYWLNSGEWTPWAIRAFIVGVLAYLAVTPKASIWIRDTLYPRWQDGKPMGYGYVFRWWLTGIEHWWEDRKASRNKRALDATRRK